MTDGTVDLAKLLEEMREGAFQTVADKINRLSALIDELEKTGHLAEKDQEEFRREVHSLKGLGGTFQMPLVSQFSKAFENYLKSCADLSPQCIQSVRQYLIRLEEITKSQEINKADCLEKWLEGLPRAEK